MRLSVMAIKKRPKITEQAALLADEIADKAYGTPQSPEANIVDPYVTTSISITSSMLNQLEDLAMKNKRSKSGPKNVSALIRHAVNNLLVNN